MNKDNLQNYIQSILPMPSEKAKLLTEKFELIEIKSNLDILTENKTPRATYILESGLVRSYTVDSNGNEITTNIFSPFCFVNDFLSFFKQKPSSENFQSLTDCVLWKMKYEDVQESFHSIPEFREFGRMMLILNYSNLKDRMLGMIKDSAEKRYLKLMKKQPEILKSVSLKIVASYLGITDTSLSRIRKETSLK
ncbi:Crp/Fnr family transcriptional regulator [Tenacibaculum retecalamus]|uniref:Crp/Fnr family transcriptional regulator n=1 Tax=Tenacibaculum retecalamus TaxID=3018315 RepID=UPI0023D8EA24|nr:Crp/Fnr family transcriptional regulator [Tenacibaculum retecalamus]WBX71688.1 Crp/Fnr family transcriptional regulator [Tenacibaculum retecalamus]